MSKTLSWMLVLCGTLLAGRTWATPASGFTGTTIALGRFDSFEARNRAILAGATTDDDDAEEAFWRSVQKTRGLSDVYVQSNVWAVGGHTGWHTHPGHSLIIVTAGSLAVYESDDPTCTPRVYTVGMGFVDPGGGHVHFIRNEGSVEARTIAVQVIPAGAVRRIDAPAPAACPL